MAFWVPEFLPLWPIPEREDSRTRAGKYEFHGVIEVAHAMLYIRWQFPWFQTWLRFFRAFFLSCKANARVKLAKTGHGPHSCTLVVFVLFGCYLCCSMYFLCVNVYCHRVTTPLQLINVSYHNFCRVLNVMCFLLGKSPASEFYMPTFRNTLFRLHRRVGILHTYPPMKMEQTEYSETSAYKIQTPGNYPEENIRVVSSCWTTLRYATNYTTSYSLFWFVHLDTCFVDPAHKMYQYSLRMATLRAETCSCV